MRACSFVETDMLEDPVRIDFLKSIYFDANRPPDCRTPVLTLFRFFNSYFTYRDEIKKSCLKIFLILNHDKSATSQPSLTKIIVFLRPTMGITARRVALIACEVYDQLLVLS